MKEIKFRAWVKSETGGTWYMSYPRWIDLEGKRICTESGLQPSEFKLMRFTGLCDKSGREIYESDKFKNPKTGLIGIVIFKDGCFFVRWPDGQTEYLHSASSYAEYIGNIYEELLMIEKELESVSAVRSNIEKLLGN